MNKQANNKIINFRPNPNKKTNENKENKIKKFFVLLKDYYYLIYFSLVSIFLIIDYFVFTDVLNLNQSYFFNYIITSPNQITLLIFIIFPIIAILLFLYLMTQIQNFYTKKMSNINKYKKIIFFCILMLSPFFLIYYAEKLNDLLFCIIFSIELLLIFISVTYILLNDIQKKSYKITIIFYMIFLATLIIKIKTANDIAKVYLLILFLSLFYYLSYSAIQYALASTKETKKSTINSVNNIIFMVVLEVAILIFLYNKDVFNNDTFEKSSENTLSNANFALLTNRLRIESYKKDDIDPNAIYNIKYKYCNKFDDESTRKYCNKYTSESKERYFKEDLFEKQNLKYFYIPFGNYRIVFIQDTKSKDIILTAFANIKEDKIKKVLDVGYIKVFKSFLIQ